MKKTIGTYTVKLDSNSNLITVTNNNEMIYGKVVSAHNTGSAFNSICKQLTKKQNKS